MWVKYKQNCNGQSGCFCFLGFVCSWDKQGETGLPACLFVPQANRKEARVDRTKGELGWSHQNPVWLRIGLVWFGDHWPISDPRQPPWLCLKLGATDCSSGRLTSTVQHWYLTKNRSDWICWSLYREERANLRLDRRLFSVIIQSLQNYLGFFLQSYSVIANLLLDKWQKFLPILVWKIAKNLQVVCW